MKTAISKPSILIVGPYPPPLGGVFVECQAMTKSLMQLNEQISVDTFNTNRAFLSLCLQVPNFGLQLLRCDTILIYGSRKRVSQFSIVIVPIVKILRKRIIIRIAGGDLWEYFQSCNSIVKKLLGWTLFRADAVLLQTKYLVNKFQHRSTAIHWFPTSRIPPAGRQAIENKQQIDSESSKNDGGDRGILKVIYLGHINESKGVPLLIEAADSLGNAQVDFFGQFSCKDGKELSEEHFTGRNARYLGVVQPSELFDILDKYDVLVLPTQYSGEGYPSVIIEAKCAGLAVISTRWRSIPEIVNHQKDGLLVEPGNVDDLTSALQYLCEDRTLLASLQRSSCASFDNFDSRYWHAVLLHHLLGTYQPDALMQ